MPLPLLAALALSAGLEGTKAFLGSRNAKADRRKQAQASAYANLSQSAGGKPMQEQQTMGQSPFDLTNLDEQMQQELFNQIFKGILSPKGTTP